MAQVGGSGTGEAENRRAGEPETRGQGDGLNADCGMRNVEWVPSAGGQLVDLSGRQLARTGGGLKSSKWSDKNQYRGTASSLVLSTKSGEPGGAGCGVVPGRQNSIAWQESVLQDFSLPSLEGVQDSRTHSFARCFQEHEKFVRVWG